jgi:hypothetical protein
MAAVYRVRSYNELPPYDGDWVEVTQLDTPPGVMEFIKGISYATTNEFIPTKEG